MERLYGPSVYWYIQIVSQQASETGKPTAQQSRVLNRSEGVQDWLFCWYEFLIVSLLFTAIISCVVVWVASQVFGEWTATWKKIADGMEALDTHWKALFLILIPLVFRPVRQFLMNLEQGPLGTKTRPVASAEQPTASEYNSHRP